jgi:hypothetical protein
VLTVLELSPNSDPIQSTLHLKVKFLCLKRHSIKTYGGVRYSSTHPQPRHCMDMSGQLRGLTAYLLCSPGREDKYVCPCREFTLIFLRCSLCIEKDSRTDLNEGIWRRMTKGDQEHHTSDSENNLDYNMQNKKQTGVRICSTPRGVAFTSVIETSLPVAGWS